MLSLVWKDKQNNTTQCLYIKSLNQKLVYYGFKWSNKMIYDLDKNILKDVYNLIRVKKHHRYIGDEKGYKVYLDVENNIKHFLKDGCEDFMMFYHYNGQDAILYKNKDKNLKKTLKKFRISNIVIYFNLAYIAFMGLSAVGWTTSYMMSDQFKFYDIPHLQYQVSSMMGLENITKGEAKKLIHDSTGLTQKQKECLINDTLFDYIFPYYEGTDMEYIIRMRLKDINVKYDASNGGGFYDLSNILHLDSQFEKIDDNNEKKKSIMIHEYIHLFQSIDCPIYLKESSASLINTEFFGKDGGDYNGSVPNLKLLIETLGPKVVWNYIFSGDDKEFKEYLDKYLTKEDAKSLIDELNISPAYGKHNNAKIKELIEKMYKNMYGIDIKDDPYIYNKLGKYIDKRYYLYQNKDYQDIEGYSYEDARKLEIVKAKKLYLFEKELTRKEFYNMKNKFGGFYGDYSQKEEFSLLSIEFKQGSSTIYKGNNITNCSKEERDHVKIRYENGDYEIISIEEALTKKIIKNVHYMYYYYTTHPNDKKLADMTNDGTYYHIDVIKNETYSNIRDNHDLMWDEFYFKKGIDVYKNIPSIKDRFPDQIISNINSKNKLK